MKRIDSLLRSLLVGTGILLLTGFAVPSVSQAADLIFDLTSDHCNGGGFCGGTSILGGGTAAAQTSFGNIEVVDSGGGVNLTLTLIHGNLLVDSPGGGIGGIFDVVFNLGPAGGANPQITLSTLSGQGGFLTTPSPQQATGENIHFDGVGDFEYGLDCDGCGAGTAGHPGPFSIHISGITTASFAPNSSGQYFGVDIYSGTTMYTGAVDASGFVASTPEPSTVVLYGLGLTMLIVGQKWRKSREISANLD